MQEGAVVVGVVQRPAADGLKRRGAGGGQTRRERAHRAEERVEGCARAARRAPARTHGRRGWRQQRRALGLDRRTLCILSCFKN